MLDCAVLLVPAHAAWMREWLAANRDHGGALQLHAHGLGNHPDAWALDAAAVALRRFDACLLPVTPASLAWTRTALAAAAGRLETPMLAVVRDMKAAAMQDLLACGVRDFLRAPCCMEELRARLVRAVSAPHAATPAQEAQPAQQAQPPAATAETGVHPLAIRELHTHYASVDRPRMPQDAIDQAVRTLEAATRIHVDEPFRQAKNRVVDDFEQEYVRTALSRHAGNVARAARASSKHRRAFWALMRKHHIDAAPYRRREGRDAGG
jgi:DNA-binding NtrC family response regulator